MPTKRVARSSAGASTVWGMVAVLLVLVGLGTGATLWATGVFETAAPVSREGQVAFPSLVRPVKAYERITREDLVDLQTQSLKPIWLDEEMVSPGLLRDLSQIIGRVVARDKQPGYILTESDFLPVGTRPGVTAGVPPGKRSLSIAVEKVPGLELLRQGDTFDLLAALPARKEAISNIEQAALLGGIKPPDTRSGQLAKQTGIKPLVLGGMMVALTKGSTQSTIGAQSLVVDAQAATRQRNQSSIVATVAVDPEEVAPLTEALGLDVEMYCVARSGHAEDESEVDETISFEGMVPVVTTSRAVDAFTALGPEDLADSVTGRLNVFYFSPDRIEPDWITDFSSLVGRVVAKDIPHGSVLSEAMLLPRGTRPGLVAGAPQGTVVLPVASNRMTGLNRLRNGDRFAVYARLPEALRPAFPQTDWATLQGAVLPDEDRLLEEQLRTGVRLVVKEAVLIGQADSGSATKETSEQVVGIAVPEEAVTQLSQLLQGESELFVAASSGREQSPSAHPERKSPVPRQAAQEPNSQSAKNTYVSFKQDAPSDEFAFSDRVAVPVTARPIKAYSKLTLDDFIAPSTGRPRTMLFPADRVRTEWVRDLNELIDRVVTRDIDTGRVIEESTLLPVGSQPGTTAGIPKGMLGMSVNGQQVLGLDGLEDLHRGDRFQLVAVRPYDIDALGGTVRRGLTNGDAIQQALGAGDLFQRAIVDVLCSEVQLVDFGADIQTVQSSVVNETQTTTETQLTPNGPIRVVNELVTPEVNERQVTAKTYLLALQPNDVGQLAQALAVGTQIIAVPLPGTSADQSPPTVSIESGLVQQPTVDIELPRPKIVEHIRGTEVTRDVWITPTKPEPIPSSNSTSASVSRITRP
ncbi:SAF domain protein [Thalassoglobus neptunius]|uniref:SAF domain protein n=1 Tax=Thalassoglobus neptunius TaxID=1938619 RepID=A0A5C5X909_9PLAN|nr:hypothetical protein [Thalassoglobus neptunius]TWT58861.1 SAF domain protein [Thalassoglobus neptunius]